GRPTSHSDVAFEKTWSSTSEAVGSERGTTPVPDPPRPPPPQAACDEPRLRRALKQLALGLHALHSAGMVHRDVKPSNILVTGDGRVVLVDFGLVAELHGASKRDAFGGAVVGTAGYMAPEQAGGDVGPAADWYSVGCIIYQALTGRLPFTGSATRILTDKQ